MSASLFITTHSVFFSRFHHVQHNLFLIKEKQHSTQVKARQFVNTFYVYQTEIGSSLLISQKIFAWYVNIEKMESIRMVYCFKISLINDAKFNFIKGA